MLDYERALLERSESFQKFLDEQASKHREYLEGFYTKIFTVIGIAAPLLVGVFGVLLPLYYAQQINNARQKITSKFNVEIDRLVKQEVAAFQTNLNASLDDFKSALSADKARANQQVDSLKAHIDAQITLSRQTTERDISLAVEYASAIAYAAVVLGVKPTTDPKRNAMYDKERETVIGSLEGLRGKLPRNRTFNIFLARLYRARDDLRKAIGVLTDVIETRARSGIAPDADDAALLYNRACYRTLLAKKIMNAAGGSTPDSLLMTEAWSDLKQCVQVSPNERGEARNDPDLDGLIDSAPDRTNWDQL